MSKPSPLVALPRQLSLSSQAAEALRTAIASGTWTDALPSERRLCKLLQVSRPTVRTALHLLAKDGLIQIHQGRRNRLLAHQPRSVRKESRLIGLITFQRVSDISMIAYQGVSEMRIHLAEHGFSTEMLILPPASPAAQRRKVEEFVRQNRLFCCVLISVSQEIQSWFYENGLPALVLGSCGPGVKLPSLDADYRAVCRHAAGVFLAKGHRRLALVVPDSNVGGHLASIQGFREGVEQHRAADDARATIVRHRSTAQNIGTKLDILFRSDDAPTALLVAKPQHAFIVLVYLLKRGLAVPDKLSFIARDHDQMFETVSPPITHYSLSGETYAHLLSRLMLQMVNQGYLNPEPNLISPTFFAGGTVRQLQDAAGR